MVKMSYVSVTVKDFEQQKDIRNVKKASVDDHFPFFTSKSSKDRVLLNERFLAE